MTDEDTIKMIEGLGIPIAKHIEILESKIKVLEKSNSDLYAELGAASGEILKLKIRVANLEDPKMAAFEEWVNKNKM